MSLPDMSPFGSTREQPTLEPQYQIVLFNDDDHSYDYVCEMLSRLFGMTGQEAWEIAYKVDYIGEAVVAVLPFDEALVARDAIRNYGPDPRLECSSGSMKAIIQSIEEA